LDRSEHSELRTRLKEALDTDSAETVTNVLKGSRRVLELFDEKMINRGFSWVRVTVSRIGVWLLAKARRQGRDKAVDEFIQFLELSFCPGHEILFFTGVTIEREFHLIEDISLKPHVPPGADDPFEDEGFSKPRAILSRPVQLEPISIDPAQETRGHAISAMAVWPVAFHHNQE
jgi:hypothetical protein